MPSIQNRCAELGNSIKQTLSKWEDVQLPLLPQDEEKLRQDHARLIFERDSLEEASILLAEQLTKQGSIQEATEVREVAKNMQQEIAELKFKHRDTLGAPSRPASVVSSMHSGRSVASSIHSSASSAERKKIALADAAALKARLAYEAKAKEVEHEISNLEIDEDLERKD